ncbi:MAG: DUF373 family protein [Nitrososphaerota archaeon]|jgi:putative membrane protein|nr:DUF373 family protein [Nitrososphaerota archaeon]
MADKDLEQQTRKVSLILCVDRDGDIEVKAGVKTPVLGREANLSAAIALALKDPEEPDANAMFEAVRLYDEMVSKKKIEEDFEIATISGTATGGVISDRKLTSELDNILKMYTVSDIIFVSDGYTDEAVFPIIQSRNVCISAVRRIVIKHNESIEETAAVFTKYLKLIIDTPKYSRVALGLPGILVTILAFFWALDLIYPDEVSLYYYGIAMAIVVGGFLVLKGFGVDTSIKKSYSRIQNYSPPPPQVIMSSFITIAGILCIILSIYLGIQYTVYNLSPPQETIVSEMSQLPIIVALFIKGAADLLVIGAVLVATGRSATFYFEKDSRLLRNLVVITEVAWIRMILNSTANLLQQQEIILGFQSDVFRTFIWSIIIGVLMGIASILVITVIGKSKAATGFFKESDKEKPETDEQIVANP